MIKKLIKEIVKETKAVNEDFYCEVEYDGKYNDFVDVRIIDDGFVPVSEMVLNRFLQNRLIHNTWDNDEYSVEIPSDDEVKFGFSGRSFERIAVEIPEDLRNKNMNVLINFEVEYCAE